MDETGWLHRVETVFLTLLLRRLLESPEQQRVEVELLRACKRRMTLSSAKIIRNLRRDEPDPCCLYPISGECVWNSAHCRRP